MQQLDCSLHLFGSIGYCFETSDSIIVHGKYDRAVLPYEQCGIILIPTASGSGVQIKVVEALAAGRAIVARKGAMRGLPAGNGAWLEVEMPEEMILQAERLRKDKAKRLRLMASAHAYHSEYLDRDRVVAGLQHAYHDVCGREGVS
jgi:glycosyltransferase involved in cell wall biosynthesis